MKTADLQLRVSAAAQLLDQRWITAARRISAPMPQWLGIASGVGVAGATAAVSLLLPKPLRKMLLSSAAPLLFTRVLK